MESPTLNPKPAALDFLSGGGQMGKFIRSFDWSKTPLGLPDTWPQSLRTTVSLCIASNFPIAIAWGPHRVQIYNDGYWPITGDMHPTSMGQDFKECWFSAWPVIGQAFEEASLGQTRFLENQRIFLDRYGYKEETFFTFSFSPILDESGGVGGLFHPVIEQTQQTLAERRLNILHTIPDHTVNAKTAEEASALVAECLKDFELDIPFVLLYSIADDGKQANIEGSVGVEAGSPIAPSKINLEVQHSDSWPFTEVIQNGKAVQVDELGKIFGTFNCGPYPEAPHQALIFPITLTGATHNNYVLVAGVSSRRNLDEKYRLFYELLAEATKNALAKARAYEEERKKAEALAAIDKAKTVFFNNISHEFRTPLTLMLGSLEELLNNRSEEIGKENKTAVETSHRNAMRLLRLVNNLLDFSRLEAGRVQAQYQLTDVAKYTTDLASNFRSVVEKAGLKFQVKTDAVIQPVYLDKTMWEKIVLNLLSNAFKYTLKGSITISLTARNDSSSQLQSPLNSSESSNSPLPWRGAGGEVILKVKDTGVGIPENELPKMFQRFHRVQNVVGRTYEGTGIGLSLVSELVKLHGGEISVESKEGEGSVFTVSIPTGKNHLPKEQVIEKETDPMALTFNAALAESFIDEATTLIEQPISENETEINLPLSDSDSPLLWRGVRGEVVLVVDDNADMRSYIKTLLQKQYNVITANNGMDALHQIKKHSPQLVVSDIMMPVMDGIQLLKAVKENIQTRNIPVILLSARAGEEEKIEGYETGADDYLVKPFSAKELLARVAANLKTAKLRQAAESHVRNLFMQAPAVICVLRGPLHIYELANAMYLQLIGNRDIVGKPVREALPELEGTGIFELLDGVYKTGEPFIGNEIPVTIHRESGKLEEGFFNFVYQPSYNVQGEIDGILVHGVEVTEQILARKRIEESEERLRNFSNSIYNLAWMADGEGYIYWYNQRWYDYTGTNIEEMKGWGWEKVHHTAHIERVMSFVKEAWKKPEPFELTFPLRSKEGEYRWFLTRAVPVVNEEGKIFRWIGTNTDINDQKLAEDRFRTLSEALPQLVWMTNEKGAYEYASNQWMEYSGLDPHDEGTWPILVYADDMEPMMKAWTNSLETGETYHAEARLKSKTGEYHWHVVQGEPIRNESGTIIKWIGAFTDIHEQKTIEEKLEKLVAERTKELERSNEDLQQFAHVASHDLKEPVRKIKTFSSRLEAEANDMLSERGKLYLEKVQSAADRMYTMIDGVLAYSSINVSEQPIEKVDVQQTIKNIETDLEVLIHQKAATIQYSNLPQIDGASVLIYQLFFNLIYNSLKFAKTGVPPQIIITGSFSKEDMADVALITVSDNGIGFSQAYSEKIFNTFTRLHSKDQYEGTGLGLSLCKKIVQRHHGSIRAEGIDGEGAAFIVALPVKQKQKRV